MDIVIKGVMGGIMTGFIAWAAKRGNILPGVLPLFPTLGIIALYLVGLKGNTTGFRQACVTSVKTLPAYLAFLLTCYCTVLKVDFRISLATGIAAWLAAALVAIVVLPRLV